MKELQAACLVLALIVPRTVAQNDTEQRAMDWDTQVVYWEITKVVNEAVELGTRAAANEWRAKLDPSKLGLPPWLDGEADAVSLDLAKTIRDIQQESFVLGYIARKALDNRSDVGVQEAIERLPSAGPVRERFGQLVRAWYGGLRLTPRHLAILIARGHEAGSMEGCIGLRFEHPIREETMQTGGDEDLAKKLQLIYRAAYDAGIADGPKRLSIGTPSVGLGEMSPQGLVDDPGRVIATLGRKPMDLGAARSLIHSYLQRGLRDLSDESWWASSWVDSDARDYWRTTMTKIMASEDVDRRGMVVRAIDVGIARGAVHVKID